MKHHYGWIIILLGALVVACTKQYTPPTYWDVKIARSGDTLTAVAYNSKSTTLKYIWHNNGVRSEGLRTVIKPGRNEVQLSVLDDKGGSISEYLNVVK